MELKELLDFINTNQYYEMLKENQINDNLIKINKNSEKYNKYKINEQPSMFRMCKKIGALHEYVYYKQLSESIHVGYFNMKSVIDVKDSKSVVINANEDYTDIKEKCFQLISLVVPIINEMIKRYAPQLDKLKKYIKELYEQEESE